MNITTILRENQIYNITVNHDNIIIHGYKTTSNGNIAVSGKAPGFYEALNDYKLKREKAEKPWYNRIPDDMITPKQAINEIEEN